MNENNTVGKKILLSRIEELCKRRGVKKMEAYTESGVGKNFGSNLKTSNPSKKNLNLLAKYFDCSVEYLTGEEDHNDYAERAIEEVIEWLEGNEYEISQDEHDVYTIGKDGNYCYYQYTDFANECMRIKEAAKDGFELSMLRWESEQFSDKSLIAKDGEEALLLEVFRSLSRAGKMEVSHFLLTIRDTETAKGKGAAV